MFIAKDLKTFKKIFLCYDERINDRIDREYLRLPIIIIQACKDKSLLLF
jgi:hypothetical protein